MQGCLAQQDVRTLRCPVPLIAVVPATVLDPFGGAGTTALVAAKMGRSAILTELNPKYVAMAADRIRRECGLLAAVEVDEKAPEKTHANV